MSYSIAIDGPAGAGKSTIAKQAAKQLSFIYVDTGAMYRAVALYMIRTGVKDGEEEALEEALAHVDVTIVYEDGNQQVLLNGENVSSLIRTEEVGRMASAVAKNQKVREKLVDLQRRLAKTANVIMDGRDIGTHVLPDAPVKIYLTASAQKRAERRYKELAEKGEACVLEEIKADIIARDEQDMNRDISPLKQAEDAILLDTSNLGIQESVEAVLSVYHNAVKKQ